MVRMKTALAAFVLLLSLGRERAQAQNRVTIADTLFNADGSRTSGKIVVSWPAFTSADNFTITKGTLSVNIVSGTVSIQLAPTEGASPPGTSYTVNYSLSNAVSYIEYWTVPATGPVTIAQVRTIPAPVPTTLFGQQQLTTGTGLQSSLGFWRRSAPPVASAEGQCYWDIGLHTLRCADPTLSFNSGTTADPTKVLKSGDTMTGLLALSGDPVTPMGAATKQYTDMKETPLTFNSPISRATNTISCVTCEVTGNKNAASGYAGLTAGALLRSAQFPVLAGDVTTSGGSLATTLADSGVTAGTYTKLTVDAKGRGITGAQAQFLDIGGSAALAQLPVGAANQLQGTNAGATAQEHKTLAVGAAGTDFGIVHSPGLATFNLPDASATARGAVTTGAQTFAGNKTFGTSITAKVSNGIRHAELFDGGDEGAKIQACIDDLPADGGTCDARGFVGDIYGASTLNVGSATKPVVILLGPSRYISQANPVWNVAGSSWIIGQSSGKTGLVFNGINNDGVHWTGSYGGMTGVTISAGAQGRHALVLQASGTTSIQFNRFEGNRLAGTDNSSCGIRLIADSNTALVSFNEFLGNQVVDFSKNICLDSTGTQGPTNNQVVRGHIHGSVTGSTCVDIVWGDVNDFGQLDISDCSTGLRISSNAVENRFKEITLESNTLDVDNSGVRTEFSGIHASTVIEAGAGTVVRSVSPGFPQRFGAVPFTDNLPISGAHVKFITEPNPVIPPTATLINTAVGNVTDGNHTCAVTVVTANGETVSTPASNTVTVDGAHKQVSLTGIPTGTVGVATARNIYCTIAGNPGGIEKFVATIADNTTTAYTFNTADGDLGAIAGGAYNSTAGGLFVDGNQVAQFTGTANGFFSVFPTVVQGFTRYVPAHTFGEFAPYDSTLGGQYIASWAGATAIPFFLDAFVDSGADTPYVFNAQKRSGTSATPLAATDPFLQFTNNYGAPFFQMTASGRTEFGDTVIADKNLYAALVAVMFSATPTFNAGSGNSFKITLTDNVTSSTLSGATAGQILSFLICQDNPGAHTFVWPANVRGGMTIGLVVSKCSAQNFLYDGTNAYALSTGIINQ